jgi:hypothetical protein
VFFPNKILRNIVCAQKDKQIANLWKESNLQCIVTLRCSIQVGLTMSAKVFISITHPIHIGLVHTPVYHSGTQVHILFSATLVQDLRLIALAILYLSAYTVYVKTEFSVIFLSPPTKELADTVISLFFCFSPIIGFTLRTERTKLSNNTVSSNLID